MEKAVKEMADELGVDKQKIYRYIEDQQGQEPGQKRNWFSKLFGI